MVPLGIGFWFGGMSGEFELELELELELEWPSDAGGMGMGKNSIAAYQGKTLTAIDTLTPQ